MMKLSKRTKIIRFAFIKLGIKTDYNGFDYLVEAVKIFIDQNNSLMQLQDLLDLISKKTNEPRIGKIEANIQNAINSTYDDRGFNSINDLYEFEVFKSDRKPTISELVRFVAYYYEFKLYPNTFD